MAQFLVIWEIDIEAATPREAAERALAIQRNPKSIATCFKVEDRNNSCTYDVDLNEAEPG